jgi:hypothetical protein
MFTRGSRLRMRRGWGAPQIRGMVSRTLFSAIGEIREIPEIRDEKVGGVDHPGGRSGRSEGKMAYLRSPNRRCRVGG